MNDDSYEPPPEGLGAPEDLEAVLASLGNEPSTQEAQEATAAPEASLADLQFELSELSEFVNELGKSTAWAVDQLTEHPAGGPWFWAKLDADAEKALWKEVGDFVSWLNTRILHHIVAGEVDAIPGCWYRHPSAVEQLTALMVAHKAVYQAKSKKATMDLVSWFDRALWPTMRALKDTGAFTGCRLGHHHENDVESYAHDDGFAAFTRQDSTVTSDGELIPDA